MALPADLATLVGAERPLRALPGGVLSSVDDGAPGARYDRIARFYDQLIGSPLYNRVIWGASPADYTAFAAEAYAAGDGPFLDAGCGTAVFTAAVYRSGTRPLVLADRSLGMLEKATERVGGVGCATALQADLLDLPTPPASFGAIGCFAMLHVLDEPWLALRSLAAQLRPSGRLFSSMLVTDRGGISTPYLRMLRRRGELGPLRSAAEFESAARALFPGGEVSVARKGAMAYVRVTASPC